MATALSGASLIPGIDPIVQPQITQEEKLPQVKNAALKRDSGGLRAVTGFQFREQMADMKFDGDFGNPQRTADFLVASAFRDEFQDFDFPRGEFSVGHAFGQAGSDGGRNAAFTAVNCTDGLNQILTRGGFDNG